jgi:phage tail sheath protein FI
MSSTYTYPGVYIQELPSPVHPITGVATSITAFVGYTATGIDNRAEMIFSFADYQRLFGGLAANSELSYAVQQFFQNGGSMAYVVRVPPDQSAPATVVFAELTFSALSSGAWANGQLIIDVDTIGLAKSLTGTVGVTAGNTTVTGQSFNTMLKVGQWLIFGSDITQTAYQIQSINSAGTSLILVGTGYAEATNAATTAVVLNDPTAFNLTITNLGNSSQPESFPAVSLNPNLIAWSTITTTARRS